jgi:hypothetical protein
LIPLVPRWLAGLIHHRRPRQPRLVGPPPELVGPTAPFKPPSTMVGPPTHFHKCKALRCKTQLPCYNCYHRHFCTVCRIRIYYKKVNPPQNPETC